MADIIPFPSKPDAEPMDEATMVSLNINGKGEIYLVINAYCETREQHDWIISKMVEAASRLVDRKKEID